MHKINKVLVAPTQTVYGLLDNPDLSILKTAVDAAGLADALNDPNATLTVFAPTNEAFEKLAQELGLTLQELLDFLLANPEVLTAILLYHVLGQVVFSAALRKCYDTKIKTLQGKSLVLFKKYKDCIKVIDKLCRKSKIVVPNVLATNGVAHIINKVLLPFSV